MGVVFLTRSGAKTGRNVRTVTTTYSALVTDDVIFADASGGSFTITLPAAAVSTDVRLDIKKIDSSGGVVTVDGSDAETIDGQLTQLLTAQWSSITVVCNGTAWFIL